ncbi:MAG: hypothetical protein M3069_09865 [Chloroflexota bacterium]|nr:hypothetical protein [Chloroflexota bacterium]
MDEPQVEQSYLVPTHLKAQQSIGPVPARFMLPLIYSGVFAGGPLGVTAWQATGGLLPAAVGAALIPPLLVSPIAAWWLDPPAEHGIMAAAGFVKRTYRPPEPKPAGPVAVYRMQTTNLETASVAVRRRARAQWGGILNGLTHPIKIIVRGRPLTTLPVVETLREHPATVARQLGEWFEGRLVQDGLVERDRLLVVPAADESELRFRTEMLEKVLRQARLGAERIDPADLPLLRTLTWNPMATEAEDAPEVMEEGASEVMADGWWTRAYALGDFPAAILTNWASPLLAGDEALDVAIDVLPRDVEDVKTWVITPKISRLVTSQPSVKRTVALEQLQALHDALERRRVMPFDVAVTVLVRGNTRQGVRERSDKIVQRARGLGAKLKVLRWEQAAGLMQLDPAQAARTSGGFRQRSGPLPGRALLVETGTLARTYPWSDGYLQLADGVPWGDAGNRPCVFTPFVKANRGPHMAWYGTTNAGKGTGAHMLWSRLHLVQGIRIFGIDQDEQHEHCGRFLEYLGGRKLTPRDAVDVSEIELHPDDGVVILDLSELDEQEAGAVYAAWTQVVKGHMLAHPGRSIMFVDEAVTISEHPAGARALRDSFQRGRHWGQSSHALTQRPSDWFGTRVGRAIQGNCDAWWCGAQQPREMDEVAKALRLADEEHELIEGAGIGTGLLVSGQRRVWLDLFDKLSPGEYAAFNSDPVVVPFTMKRREQSA